MKNTQKQSTVMTHYYDYPDKDIHCYKRHQIQEQQTNPKIKAQVLEVKKAVAKRQREMVRELDQRKKYLQKEAHETRLRMQIAQKKRQIQELEIQRQRAEQQQLKSFELAKIREEELQKERQEKERRRMQLNRNAKIRGEEALRRADDQRIELEAKEREAQRRRDVAAEAERRERKRAIKYREEQEALEPVQNVKVGFEDFNRNHGTAKYNRNVDYSKTFMHNPVVVKAKESIQIDAHERARKMQEEIQARRQRKLQAEEQQQQRADERSVEAFRRLSAQKMAQQLKREAASELLKYNQEKIEMGKRDQEIGVRPLTRMQKQINKQARDEKEFEDIFFKGKNLEWVSEPVQRHEIEAHQQRAFKQRYDKVEKKVMIPMQKIPSDSRIPQASTVRYSFEDEGLSVGSQQFGRNNYDERQNEQEEYQTSSKKGNSPSQHSHPSGKLNDSPMTQTRKSPRPPVSPPKATVKQMMAEADKNNKVSKNSSSQQGSKGERRIVYNQQTDQSKDSNSKFSPLRRSDQSSQFNNLNNLCENRHQSDLSYSEDEEDSIQN